MILIAFAIYFLPAVVAVVRNHNAGLVVVVNLFLGWTLIGWFIALIMALGPDKPQQITINYEPTSTPSSTPLTTSDFDGARKLIPRG